MRLSLFGIALLAAVSARAAEPVKIAMMPIAAGEGVPDKMAATLTEAVIAELRRAPDVQVTTQAEIAAVLSHEQQQLMAGCDNDACVADVGGALGVDRLVTGHVAKLGESWLVTLKLIDVKKASTLKQADRRLRKATIDDVLDELPAMAGELLDAPLARPPAPVKTPPPAAEATPMSPSIAEKPLDVSAIRARLVLVTDGQGLYIAFDPKAESFAPFYAGDKAALFAQRVVGGGRNGPAFDQSFWEPRAKARWQASFGFKDGKYALQCGDREIPFAIVNAAETKAILTSAKFFDVRWQRRGFAIARNDDGIYWFVDQAREPDDSTDFRMFVGRKGKVAAVAVDDAMIDEGGQTFITANGKLKLVPSKREAEWIEGRQKSPLTYLDIEDQAAFVYTLLGAYKGEKLGTPCDDRF